MKVFGIESKGQLLGTGPLDVPFEQFRFKTALWNLQVNLELKNPGGWPRAHVRLRLARNGVWHNPVGDKTFSPKCDLRENPKEIEDFVRGMLDEHSLLLTEVYRSLPEEENTDPDSLTIFGVQCFQRGDDRVYTGQGYIADPSIVTRVSITPMEHLVSPSHTVKAEVTICCNEAQFVVEDESNLEEVEKRMKEKLCRSLPQVQLAYLV